MVWSASILHQNDIGGFKSHIQKNTQLKRLYLEAQVQNAESRKNIKTEKAHFRFATCGCEFGLLIRADWAISSLLSRFHGKLCAHAHAHNLIHMQCWGKIYYPQPLPFFRILLNTQIGWRSIATTTITTWGLNKNIFIRVALYGILNCSDFYRMGTNLILGLFLASAFW